MLFISVFLFQATHFHQSRTLGTPIRRTSNVLASMFIGFSKRAAYEKFSEKLSSVCSIKRKGNLGDFQGFNLFMFLAVLH